MLIKREGNTGDAGKNQSGILTLNIIKGERMSEEQVIISYAIIERTFEKAGDAKAQWLMIKSISEPAPPKDWRPVCYDSQYNKLNGCDPGFNAITKTCQQCPFLATRHRVQVKE